MANERLLFRLAGLAPGRSEHQGRVEFVIRDAAGEEEPHEVEVRWSVDNVGARLHLHADVSGTARSRCHRCLAVFARGVHTDFVLVIQRGLAAGAGLADEIAGVPEQAVEFDLAPYVREAVILEEPIQLLCREECRGLCSHCGADLNQGPCGCGTAGDARREPLRGLWPPPSE